MPSTNHPSFITRLRGELPPSGPLPATMQTLGCRWWPYDYMTQCRERFGSRFTIYPLFMPPLVFLADPNEIREVLTAPVTDLHPGAGSRILAPLIGARSFMLLEEDEHAQRRKTITPAFHKRMIEEQNATLTGIIEREVATWPTDTPIRLRPDSSSHTPCHPPHYFQHGEQEHTRSTPPATDGHVLSYDKLHSSRAKPTLQPGLAWNMENIPTAALRRRCLDLQYIRAASLREQT